MDELREKRRAWLVCAGLALAVLAAYSPLWRAGFVAFDDNDYVTANGMVQHGFSWPAVAWAFSTFHASNWHPLTWLSYLADSQLYGMNPRGSHLTNVLLHAANSILFFLLLRRMTGALWRSAAVAGLFALHPLHVESVAWVSERKDVLSTLFWLLAAGAYVRHTERPGVWYAGSIVLFALGLMAKPMLVTLPFILLLLDLWPLRRARPAGRLLAEKIPYFILAAASCGVTFLAQERGGAVVALARAPLAARLENVPVAYVRYILKTFWPVKLAVLYPYEYHWAAWQVGGALALLALVTGWVLWRARSQPWLAVGWFWFLIMLAPVIGFVQAGPSSLADRYAYLPNAGLFLMVVWAARGAWAFLIGLALACCLALTFLQAGYWKGSETLFRHTLAVTRNNVIIENDLGKVLLQEGRADDATRHLTTAVALDPAYALAHFNLGMAYLAQGDTGQALAQFDLQVALTPGDAMAQYNFGNILLDNGLAADALPHLDKAVHLRPTQPEFRYKLANALRQTGGAAEAIKQYEKTLQLSPDHAPAAAALAWMLASSPDASLRDGARAEQLARQADQLTGGQDPKMVGILAAAQAEKGDFPAAAATARRALQLAEKQGQTALLDTLRAQLALYRAGSPARDKP